MIVKRITAGFIATFIAMISFAATVSAEGRLGLPTDKGIWLQDPASEQALKVVSFNEDLMWIMSGITIFVIVLMLFILVRFSARINPEPTKTSHNTILEVFWTGAPILILVVIGFQSIPLLYYQDVVPETEFAIRVTGSQWNWTYSYPDHDGIEFTSVLVPDSAHVDAVERAGYEADLSEFLGKPAHLNARLLDTDTRMVVPVDTAIRIQLTASDVIHAWTIPAFGVKLDAVPGRLNETWFSVNEIGTYYGQCSELCGKDHAFMPIAVEVVSKEDFAKWVEHAKAEYADAGTQTALGR